MQYELTKEGEKIIEDYRKLLPEYQLYAEKQMAAVFELQTSVIKVLLQDK